MKKNNALAFGGTKNQAFAIACVMMDVKRLSPGLIDEVVIYHDGIKRKDKKIIRTILPTRFVHYRLPVSSSVGFNQSTIGHFSKMVFSKFEAFKLLDRYHNVLFTDYDIVIRDDISELLEPCESGIKLLPAEQPVGEALHSPVGEFNMDRKSHSVAFVAVHDNLKAYHEIYKWCYRKTAEYAPSLYLPEQAVVNFAVEAFNLEPVHNEPDVYCLHPDNLARRPTAKILHAYGAQKFWSGIKNEQWESNYRVWLQAGGSPNRPRQVPITVRNIWTGFLNGIKGLARR
jgi:lipopolysaccharide biosynthesis glycosyltransferase